MAPKPYFAKHESQMCNKFRRRLERGEVMEHRLLGWMSFKTLKMAAERPAKLDYKSRLLVDQIVQHIKSQGIFDQFRRDCTDELEQKVG